MDRVLPGLQRKRIKLALNDNKTTVVDFPASFSFRYYGRTTAACRSRTTAGSVSTRRPRSITTIGTCPTRTGRPRGSPLLDNLDPTKKDNGVLAGDGIYVLADTTRHIFVVEWSRIGNTDQPATPPQLPINFKELQTFEVILFDPAYYPTESGDGIIQFQYKQVFNIDTTRMYCTVGIQDHTENDGLEYTYSNVYPRRLRRSARVSPFASPPIARASARFV